MFEPANYDNDQTSIQCLHQHVIGAAVLTYSTNQGKINCGHSAQSRAAIGIDRYYRYIGILEVRFLAVF
jgi:hypothetical protein